MLIITGKGDWIHPKHGAARLREANDEADTKVFYNDGSTHCSYRTSLAGGGKTLILSPTDTTQDEIYCPSGELKNMSR